MKKLQLNVDSLVVQGFAAGAKEEPRGTVAAYIPDTDPQLCPPTEDLPCSVGSACTYYPIYCT